MSDTPTAITQDFLIRGQDYLENIPQFELIGRDEELNKLTAILMRKRANSVLLVGPGGVGCSAICMGLQESKKDPDVPFDLGSKRFFWLDVDGLVASGDPNQINESFQKTLRTLERTGDSVLILDDMRDFIDAARNNSCPNLINALMRAVKQKKFQCIMEARDEDLEAVLKCHSDMKESFTMLDVQEPKDEMLTEIVKKTAKARLEPHHGIKISDEAIDAAIEMTSKYRVRDIGLSRAQPERSLTLLDRAMTTYKLEAHKTDPRLPELEAKLASVKERLADENYNEEQGGMTVSELQSLEKATESDIKEVKGEWDETRAKIRKTYRSIRSGEEQILDLEDQIEAQLKIEEETRQKTAERAEESHTDDKAVLSQVSDAVRSMADFMKDTSGMESDIVSQLRAKIEQREELITEERKNFQELTSTINDRLELGKEQTLTEFSRISGVPVSKLTQDEVAKLKNLEDNLGNRVYGQPEAVNKLSEQVLVSRAGLQEPNKPQAAFLYLGPSGVGKTELAKALTAELLDDENALLRFDMSEYQEKHALAKLIGAPPGYEGYEAGGILTNEMRRNPRRIILFDEIEKAHPDIFLLFLQILDDARLTDNRGLTVSFRDSIIIMTSNAGKEHFINPDLSFEEASDLAMERLGDNLPPELLNRFNGRQNIVCFDALSLPVIEKIATRDIAKLNAMVQANKPELSVGITPTELAEMCKDHYKPVEGARGIVGYIAGKVKPAISKTILFEPDAKGKIMIGYDEAKQQVTVSAPQPEGLILPEGVKANDNNDNPEKKTEQKPSAKQDFKPG
jgi:ATP-dependent Clp protease ATP-binding subunit ClpB